MPNLQIKNETVYVIYHDGQPFQERGRKLVYTTKGAASGVITDYCIEEAQRRFNRNKEWNYDWYNLGREETKSLIDEVRKEFSVVEYGPKHE